jgi:hypothetical protein
MQGVGMRGALEWRRALEEGGGLIGRCIHLQVHCINVGDIIAVVSYFFS